MDFDKIKFSSYIPGYDKYFDQYLNDESIKKYVSFSKWDSSFIFYERDFVGFYKTMVRDEELNDREIYIALVPEYRKKGIASYVVNTLVDNLFTDPTCSFAHLSIDKENESSIHLAKACGFNENFELEQELRLDGDTRTLLFSKQNPSYHIESSKRI